MLCDGLSGQGLHHLGPGSQPLRWQPDGVCMDWACPLASGELRSMLGYLCAAVSGSLVSGYALEPPRELFQNVDV